MKLYQLIGSIFYALIGPAYHESERERGQGLVEYALILVLVAVVVVAILTVVGPQIGAMFSQVTTAIPG